MKTNRRAILLSITARTTLSDQHVLSFQHIGMKDYRTFTANLHDVGSITICLNSLSKLYMLDKDDLDDYVIYLDEVSSFLELTHNNTLDKNLMDVFAVVAKFIKHAGKVIVSDAMINDAVFVLLKRSDMHDAIFVQNEFKKYAGVPAVRVRDEADCLNKLVENCRANQFFLIWVR